MDSNAGIIMGHVIRPSRRATFVIKFMLAVAFSKPSAGRHEAGWCMGRRIYQAFRFDPAPRLTNRTAPCNMGMVRFSMQQPKNALVGRCLHTRTKVSTMSNFVLGLPIIIPEDIC
jgi:hypothetical protein